MTSLTVKVGVEAVPQVGAGPKVDELQVEAFQVHQQVLVLDVTVDDAAAVAGDDGLNHLAEEAAGQLLLQHPLLSDVVKEVLAGLRPLHDNDVGVMALKTVNQPDHSRQTGDGTHQANLHGDTLTINLQEKKGENKFNALL